jgi:hypothetical protein
MNRFREWEIARRGIDAEDGQPERENQQGSVDQLTKLKIETAGADPTWSAAAAG